MKKIVIIAGDSSGDLYGGLLAKKLKEKFANLDIFSFAGPQSAKHSHQLLNLLDHSVSGIVEVLSHIKNIISIFKKIKNHIYQIKPDLVILIDFPDFNLRLAKAINKKFPIFYYVSPQVWAWRKERIELIRLYIEKMIVIFKFEKDFYEKEGIDVLYFGHPLLEIINRENIEPEKIITFLPGSRRNEVKRHLPVLVSAKQNIQREIKGYRFRIIKSKSLDEKLYSMLPTDIEIIPHSYRSLQESKFIITACGTATLEIAILQIPYLIIYKLNPMSWYLLKRLVKTEYVGIVNILNSKKIIPELLQGQANPKKIAEITLDYLKNENSYCGLKSNLKNTTALISPHDATEKFTYFIGRYLNL